MGLNRLFSILDSMAIGGVVTESLSSKMSMLIRALDGINKRVEKNSGGKQKQSIHFRKIAKSQGLGSDEDIITYLNSFDPTGEYAKYTQWIIKIFGEGRIVLPEDGEKLFKALSIFDKVKNSPKIDINKDINSYGNFRDFEQLMGKFNQSVEENNVTVRQWEKWIVTKGYRKVYSDGKYTLLRFDLTGEKIKVFPNSIGKYESSWIPEQFAKEGDKDKVREHDVASVAVAKLAAGTSYCVANPGTAENYMSSGPLFAVFKEGKFVLLADSSWSSFADNTNQMISRASPQLAFFLSRVLLASPDELFKPKRVAYIIKTTLENSNIENTRAVELMEKAVASVVTEVAATDKTMQTPDELAI